MKRWEEYNEKSGKNFSAEEQAKDMFVDITLHRGLLLDYTGLLDLLIVWLNEEVEGIL